MKEAQLALDSVLNSKKKSKRKPKKVKALVDDFDDYLDAFIAQDKTWSSQVTAALQSIRKLTVSEEDYNVWAKEGQLIEWPQTEELMQIKTPQEFRLKSFTYRKPTATCIAREGICSVRAAVSLKTLTGASPMVKPQYIPDENELELAESYPIGDFLYATGANKVKSIVFCMECQGVIFSNKDKKTVGCIGGLKNHEQCSSKFHEAKFELESDEEVLGFGFGIHTK